MSDKKIILGRAKIKQLCELCGIPYDEVKIAGITVIANVDEKLSYVLRGYGAEYKKPKNRMETVNETIRRLCDEFVEKHSEYPMELFVPANFLNHNETNFVYSITNGVALSFQLHPIRSDTFLAYGREYYEATKPQEVK